MGVGKAMELCLSGRRIYPDEAERLGIVSKACDPDELMPTVMKFAQELAAKPPLAVINIKKAIHEGINLTLQDGLTLERKLFFEAIRSDDAVQIMRLYVAAGQDREKLAALMEEAGEDPGKVAELLASRKET
jgi:enoyl-CoA hydratase/carnithine racemase